MALSSIFAPNTYSLYADELVVSGALKSHLTRRAVTADTSVTADDQLVGVDSTAGVVTVSLELAAAAGSGRVVHVVDEGGVAATANIMIAAAGGDTLNGSSSYVIDVGHGAVSLYSDGSSSWHVY